MRIYSYLDYRKYLKDRIESQPGGGRGELQRIARQTGIHSSILSQVFQGQRELTSEQTVAVAEYFGLNETDTRYLLLLAQWERAATKSLKELLKKEIDQHRSEEVQVYKRVAATRKLTMEQKAVFYSSWAYSAVRILCSLPGLKNREVLRKRIGLGRENFESVVAFLVEHGLCREESGELHYGPQSTHLEGNSPLVARHHANWRIKAMEKHPGMDGARELAFTSSMAMSRADAQLIRARLVAAIEEVCQISDPSPPETAYFLNLDWLEV